MTNIETSTKTNTDAMTNSKKYKYMGCCQDETNICHSSEELMMPTHSTDQGSATNNSIDTTINCSKLFFSLIHRRLLYLSSVWKYNLSPSFVFYWLKVARDQNWLASASWYEMWCPGPEFEYEKVIWIFAQILVSWCFSQSHLCQTLTPVLSQAKPDTWHCDNIGEKNEKIQKQMQRQIQRQRHQLHSSHRQCLTHGTVATY